MVAEVELLRSARRLVRGCIVKAGNWERAAEFFLPYPGNINQYQVPGIDTSTGTRYLEVPVLVPGDFLQTHNIKKYYTYYYYYCSTNLFSRF